MGVFSLDIMAGGRAMSVLIVILLMPVFSLTTSASSGSMVTAGSGGVAIVGLPAHQGDNLTFSSLIHNEGDVAGSVQLNLSLADGTNVLGNEVLIEPGSSREVQTVFVPSQSGLINVSWEIISSNSMVSENLSGVSQISVDEPQNLEIEFLDSSWTLANGLECTFRTILGEGRERIVSIEVSGISGSNEILIQRYDAQLTPGIRHFTLELGSPQISSLSVTAIPSEWVSNSSAIDQIEVTMPQISGSIEIISVTPEAPTSGDSVSVEVRISNSGNDPIESGRIRLISSASGIVLEDVSTSVIQSSSESSQTLTIQSWPDGNPVDLRAEWISGEVVSEFEISVISNIVVSSSESEIPWLTLIVGGSTGILVAIAMRSALRGRKPLDKRTRKEKSKPSKKVIEETEKREVHCPECDRALLIPRTYSGRARCAPPCSTEFSVSPVDEDEKEPIEEEHVSENLPEQENKSGVESLVAASNDDLLDCPQCGQVLKIPLSKRPATARCPACRAEFEALEGA
tara:strand:- start:109 stop:1653 length:1545 start_codon:yes stop_codon:yes gene_type:complete